MKGSADRGLPTLQEKTAALFDSLVESGNISAEAVEIVSITASETGLPIEAMKSLLVEYATVPEVMRLGARWSVAAAEAIRLSWAHRRYYSRPWAPR